MINLKNSLIVIISFFGLFISLFTTSCSPTQNTTSDSLVTYKLIVQPDDGREAILNLINQAKDSIKLTIYELDDSIIINSLKSAVQRGVVVNIIYNIHSFNDEKKKYIWAIMDTLTNAGMHTKEASNSFSVTHQKTFTFDDTTSSIMTFNLQSGYFQTTRDFGIITNKSQEVREIKSVFYADWDYIHFSPSENSLVWSNNNSRRKILDLITNAQNSIEIYNEELLDEECLDSLISKAKTGLNIRIISGELMQNGKDENKKSRLRLSSNGVQAKYMPTSEYLYCHAKMILVDYGKSNAKVFIGSENLSPTSLDKNRELGIIISDKKILDKLFSTFNIDWNKSKFDE